MSRALTREVFEAEIADEIAKTTGQTFGQAAALVAASRCNCRNPECDTYTHPQIAAAYTGWLRAAAAMQRIGQAMLELSAGATRN